MSVAAEESLEQRARELRDRLIELDAEAWQAYAWAVQSFAPADARRRRFELAKCTLEKLQAFELEHGFAQLRGPRGAD